MEYEGKIRFLSKNDYVTNDKFISKKINTNEVCLYLNSNNELYVPLIIQNNNNHFSPIFKCTDTLIYKLYNLNLNNSQRISVDRDNKIINIIDN